MEIKNLKKAANRILKAINNGEKIILYGDTDLDGVASVIILKETIKNLNGEISELYFPDRETEGYGISETGLTHLKTKLLKEAKVKMRAKPSSPHFWHLGQKWADLPANFAFLIIVPQRLHFSPSRR